MKTKLLKITILIFIIIATQLSCINSEKNNPTTPKQEHQKPGSSNQDTLTVEHNTAVFFQPDSLQLLKIKAANKPVVFNSMAHELFYQMRNARNVIKTSYPNVVIIESSNSRFILFKSKNEKKHLIDLNNFNDMCGIILFKLTDKPAFIDMMNIDSELGFYFKSK